MFASLLKELREKTGLTQGKISEILNVQTRTYGSWERGERQPDFETLVKIADYFNVSTDYLLGRKPMDITIVHGAPPLKDVEGGQMEIILDPKKDEITPDAIEKRMRKLIADELKKRGL